MGRDSQIFACQLARCRSAEDAVLCPSDMMLCVISYWVLSGAKRRQIQQLRCCVLPIKLLKRRDVYLKLTRHNGRAGTHGTYNPKHNDRSFNLANSEHIDPERAKGNIYWDCSHGFRSTLAPQDPDDLATTFSDVERQFYESHYTAFIESQNERNAKIRHTERNRSIPDLLSSRKTCPEETIYQLGTKDDHASAEDLLNIVTEFIEDFKAKFGDHVHVLDWALHLDESTPHIHERHVFDCENKYGEVAPQQEKALEALGLDLPDPDKPLSRRNNRKINFDAACRKMLFEIAKRHGLELEEEAEYGNRKYLEKQDFILAKQKEQLAAQQNRLDELTLKVSDMETLLENVSAAAYDKAVEVVTDVVRTETRKEDMRMIEDTKKWVLSPERKAPQPTREYAAHRLDTVLNKFLKTMQTTAARLQEKLLGPEVRQKGNEVPGGDFKRPNGLAQARWRGLAPTSSRFDVNFGCVVDGCRLVKSCIKNGFIPLSLPVCFCTLRPMSTWHPEPVSGYTPVPSEYIPPGAALQRRPSGSASRFPPSAAAERSEPSESHDRWTFSALQNALCPTSDPGGSAPSIYR